jgi:hypothetical protein
MADDKDVVDDAAAPAAPAEPPGPGLVSMAQAFTGLPMKSLIGGPLQAAANANAQMALTQLNFMIETCFHKAPIKGVKDEFNYTPVMVQLVVTRPIIEEGAKPAGTIQTKTAKSTIDIPFLTLIPLNSLAVDNVTVDFTMEVQSSYSKDTSKKTQAKTAESGSFSAKIDYLFVEAEIKGSVSHSTSTTTSNDSHYKKSNSATYNVSVHAGQLPLPPGVPVIIQALTSNITPIMVEPGK